MNPASIKETLHRFAHLDLFHIYSCLFLAPTCEEYFVLVEIRLRNESVKTTLLQKAYHRGHRFVRDTDSHCKDQELTGNVFQPNIAQTLSKKYRTHWISFGTIF